MTSCYEPLTSPTKGRYRELGCMKHAKAEPKVVPVMPVYTLRLPLQQGMTAPIVRSK